VSETRTNPAPVDPDREAIEAFRRGDAAAFDELVLRNQERILRLASRLLGDEDAALDAAQETFVKAWRALPGFEGAARFSTWLTRIAINQCRNDLRRLRTLKHAPRLSLNQPLSSASEGTTLGETVAHAGPSAWEVSRAHEVDEAFRAALGDLPAEAREVLVLREVEDLSYEDMAEILGVAVGTVRSRLHRARADVRSRMSRVLDA
jgi:RNA polymerase sigma-70 factor (ECF subfamily)